MANIKHISETFSFLSLLTSTIKIKAREKTYYRSLIEKQCGLNYWKISNGILFLTASRPTEVY